MHMKCTRCDGCGKIDDGDAGEPWSAWEGLPPGSDVAVKLGLVKPIPCPACSGSGKLVRFATDAEVEKAIDRTMDRHGEAFQNMPKDSEFLKSKELEEFRKSVASPEDLRILLWAVFRFFYYNESSPQRSLWIERIGKSLGADALYIKRGVNHQLATREME